jgi:hypothetical protein
MQFQPRMHGAASIGLFFLPSFASVVQFDFWVMVHSLEFAQQGRQLEILQTTSKTGLGRIRRHDVFTVFTPW